MSIMNYLLGGFDGVEEIPELTPGKKNPLDILKELGYTHEVHEDGKDHFVRYAEDSISKKNPYYIPIVCSLMIEKRGENKVHVVYAVNKRIDFTMDFNCGYSRARNVAISSVIRWHRISHKKNTREGKC